MKRYEILFSSGKALDVIGEIEYRSLQNGEIIGVITNDKEEFIFHQKKIDCIVAYELKDE